MSEKSNERANIFSQLADKVILRVYGTKYMCVVSPALGIEKVRISLVEIGSGGKNSSDIFLSVDEFRLFCDDIDKFIAKKKFAEDTGAFPTAYQWVKGEDGCKKLSIGGGLKGVRIATQIRTPDGGIDKKIMAVQYSDLQTMSFYFKLVTGMVLCRKNSYYDQCYNAFWSA